MDRLDAVLIHDFQPARRTLEILNVLRADARIQRAGVSLYHPTELDWLLAHDAGCDIVQVPFSLVDGRFGPWFEPLAERGIAIHARSVFLQGALLLDESRLPAGLAPLRAWSRRLRELANSQGASVKALLLGYVLAVKSLQRVVVGVDSADQLRELIQAAGASTATAELRTAFNDLPQPGEDILVPANWELG